MALFIELHSTSGLPVLVNVAHIVCVKPSGNECVLYLNGHQIRSTGSGDYLSNVFGQMETLIVKESYESVKRKIDD